VHLLTQTTETSTCLTNKSQLDELNFIHRLLCKKLIWFDLIWQRHHWTVITAFYYRTQSTEESFVYGTVSLWCFGVYEISREPLDGFMPNSQGRRAWSLARSDEFESQGQRSRSKGTKRHFWPFRRPAGGLCLVKHLQSLVHFILSCIFNCISFSFILSCIAASCQLVINEYQSINQSINQSNINIAGTREIMLSFLSEMCTYPWKGQVCVIFWHTVCETY